MSSDGLANSAEMAVVTAVERDELMVRQVYWQVADARRRASDRLVSSRSTQVGKEDFL